MTSYKIILNPISGRGTGRQLIQPITEKLTSMKLNFDLVQTQKPWHAAELTQQAVKDGFSAVVSAGGDGTANEVLNGLMLSRKNGNFTTSMGVIPVGSGNDFAYSMGLPTQWEPACELIAANTIRRIDIGRVISEYYPDGRYFGNGVGIGFDAVVGFESAKMPHLHGFLSYAVAAVKTISLYYRSPLLEIQLDDETITVPALMVSIMNGQRMGGGFFMAPNGQSDDGHFDLCIAKQMTRAGILALIPRFMKGTQFSHPAILAKHSSKVKVTALNGTLPAHADGETLCVEGHQLAMELLPAQLDLISQNSIHQQ